MKKHLLTALFGLFLGQIAIASHSIPIIGCDNGRVISSDNGELHCISKVGPCSGKLMQLSEMDGGPGLFCVKDCTYVDRAEGGEGLVCEGTSGK